MKMAADIIPGYTYGSPQIATSPVSLEELEQLKVSAGLGEQELRYLRVAGEVLADQTRQIVAHWRSGIIAGIPNLARHSRSADGMALPEYLARSNLRFQQWILDTCLRPYDQDWLNYQHEIALRHTRLKKNQVDGVQSTPYVPLRDVMAFVAVMNQTIKQYLASRGSSYDELEGMHTAWCKSIQLQIALWLRPYTDDARGPNQW
jgi:hypothetical protein